MNGVILRDRFSNVAKNYDRFASLQQEIGNNLLKRIKGSSITPDSILDIGTGTGRLTAGVASLYKNASIWAIDFSYGMLECARNRIISANLLQADAQDLPFKDNFFDLAVSNLTFQWVNNKVEAFKDVHRVLKDKGRFYFTTFGANTLRELKIAFSREGIMLPNIYELIAGLNTAGFRIIEQDIRFKKNLYPDMKSLVSWLKNIGANYTGYVVSKSLGMRKIWQDAEALYHRNFRDNGNIFATFEVITIVAEK